MLFSHQLILSFTGAVTVVFNYNVSDGALSDTGAATVNLKFNEGTQVTISGTGKAYIDRCILKL